MPPQLRSNHVYQIIIRPVIFSCFICLIVQLVQIISSTKTHKHPMFKCLWVAYKVVSGSSKTFPWSSTNKPFPVWHSLYPLNPFKASTFSIRDEDRFLYTSYIGITPFSHPSALHANQPPSSWLKNLFGGLGLCHGVCDCVVCGVDLGVCELLKGGEVVSRVLFLCSSSTRIARISISMSL